MHLHMYILQGHAERDKWDLFKDCLRESFQDVGQTDDALKWLATAKQSPHDTETMLQHMYQTAIRPELALQILLTVTSTSIEDWMTTMARLDTTMWRANLFFAKGFKKEGAQQRQPQWRPQSTKLKSDYGEPMDIDALQPGSSRPNLWKVLQEEIERRKKAQLCFKCGQSGHFANKCHTGWQYNQATTNKPKAPENKPKPMSKITATKMHHHIHMIAHLRQF